MGIVSECWLTQSDGGDVGVFPRSACCTCVLRQSAASYRRFPLCREAPDASTGPSDLLPASSEHVQASVITGAG